MAVVSHVDTQVPWDVPQREDIHLRLGDLMKSGDLFLQARIKASSFSAQLATNEEGKEENHMRVVLCPRERK